MEIHFNTRNTVEDFRSISTDPRFEQLRSLPRCPLSRLEHWLAPLTVDKPVSETVEHGMVDIFPSLECCIGFEVWKEVSDRYGELQEM